MRRAARSAQIRVSQEAGEILRRRNGGRSVARKSLIKEQQLDLFADRTSTHEMRSNQLRLYFSSFAYVLMQTLRRLGLQGTELAKAQCRTIRVKLFKIGALVRVSVRKVWVCFSESYPHAELFQGILARLQRIPLRCQLHSFTRLPADGVRNKARG